MYHDDFFYNNEGFGVMATAVVLEHVLMHLCNAPYVYTAVVICFSSAACIQFYCHAPLTFGWLLDDATMDWLELRLSWSIPRFGN
jgi:dolichyl-phosphate-mannose--protein O-mannosyl transferase